MQFKNTGGSLIRFAIVGFGFIGQRYARMLAENPFSSLVAIVDTHADIVLPEIDQPIRLFNSIEALLSSGIELDTLIISSPNGYHTNQALQALDAGKHVIIEKPLALTTVDVEKIARKANEVSRQAFSVVPNRNASAAKWLKDMVSGGLLGKLFLVQVNCYWNRDGRYYSNHWRGRADLDGGPLFTQFYHFIDLLYWLFGEVKDIKGRFADFNHQQLTETEDSGFIQFEFELGGTGLLNYSTSVWNQNLESSITILAENGSIKIGGQYMEKVEICTIKGYEFSADNLPPPSTALQNHQQLLDELVNRIKENGQASVDLTDPKHVIDIINRIYSQRDILKRL